MSDEIRIHEKIVDFRYCKFCEHKNVSDQEEPCVDCLDYAGNIDSRRPIHFKDNGSFAAFLKRIKKENNNGRIRYSER